MKFCNHVSVQLGDKSYNKIIDIAKMAGASVLGGIGSMRSPVFSAKGVHVSERFAEVA
jgi:hypothetical protein